GLQAILTALETTGNDRTGGTMKKRVLLGVLVVGVVTLAIVATALGSANKEAGVSVLPSSACGKLQYGGSGSPKYIIASDLPLQGANRPLTTEMNRAIEYMLSQQGWKAGSYTIGFQACDDSTAQKGSRDSSKCTPNRNPYA